MYVYVSVNKQPISFFKIASAFYFGFARERVKRRFSLQMSPPVKCVACELWVERACHRANQKEQARTVTSLVIIISLSLNQRLATLFARIFTVTVS
jgi:hypothetical protein